MNVLQGRLASNRYMYRLHSRQQRGDNSLHPLFGSSLPIATEGKCARSNGHLSFSGLLPTSILPRKVTECYHNCTHSDAITCCILYWYWLPITRYFATKNSHSTSDLKLGLPIAQVSTVGLKFDPFCSYHES